MRIRLSSASRNHLTTFCRPLIHYACLRLCSEIVHFIRNNCLYFVCCGWSAKALTVLAILLNSVAWQNCCMSLKTAVVNVEAFRHLIMFQQWKQKVCWTSINNKKSKVFLRTLCAFSILVQLSKIRSFKRGCASASPAAPFLCSTARIRQDIIAQSHFVVVNCADALVNMFYYPVLTRSLIFLQ